MGKSCCEAKQTELETLKKKQGKILYIVLGVNLVMFFLEFSFGIISRSTALLADSLDMLGDAAVYGFSLYVLSRSIRARTKATLLKGIIMLATGIGVGIEVTRRAFYGEIPDAQTMGLIGFVALAANVFCAFLLFRHKDDDSNLRSTWLCSRNDVIANISVIGASGLVALTSSRWPDIIVGGGIAILFVSSAAAVFKDAFKEFEEAREVSHGL